MDEPPKQNRSEMAAQLSNIAQFCDDLSFVIAGRGSAQNAADRRCGVHCFPPPTKSADCRRGDRMSLPMTVSWRGAAPCPELGVDRKWPARSQNDAIDPGRKSSTHLPSPTMPPLCHQAVLNRSPRAESWLDEATARHDTASTKFPAERARYKGGGSMKKVGVFTSMIFGLGAAYSTAATFRWGCAA